MTELEAQVIVAYLRLPVHELMYHPCPICRAPAGESCTLEPEPHGVIEDEAKHFGRGE